MIRQVNIPSQGGWHLVHHRLSRFAWDERGYLQERSSPPVLEHDEAGTAWKPSTDIVVEGHVYSRGRETTEAIATLEVGEVTRRIRATGDRQILRTAAGRCEWSAPAPFGRMPLSAARAYGGFDRFASNAVGELAELPQDFADIEPEMVSAFAYPRNRFGRGFLMAGNADANVGQILPNLDDPDDPVEETRLLREGPDDWIDAPVPAHWGWIDVATFPRTLLLGERVDLARAKRRVREVDLGALRSSDLNAAPRDRWDIHNYLPLALLGDPRGLLGAAPGMATQRIAGGELIRMVNLEARRPERVLHCPTTRPRMRVRPPGCAWFDTPPEIDTIILRPDDRTMDLVYRGALRVAGRYPPDELALVEAEVAAAI